MDMERRRIKMNETMQISYFPCGGFVLHKITGDFSGKCSAWFNNKGDILEVEQIIPFKGGITRPVKKNGPIWKYCKRLGSICKK
jgi:hypothetical protein